MAVYLLHSTVALERRGVAGVRHYLGYARPERLARRLELHATGRSKVAIIRAFHARGGQLVTVKVWPTAGQTVERRLKRGGHLARWCPICNPTTPPPGELP